MILQQEKTDNKGFEKHLKENQIADNNKKQEGTTRPS